MPRQERNIPSTKSGGGRKEFSYAKTMESKGFESRVLDLTRTARMTGGGRRFRFRALVVIGDRKGKVGLGISKGKDVPQAIDKSQKQAEKNVIFVPVIKGTIPHQVEAKAGAAKVLLKPQTKGRGLIAGGTVRIICDLAGIKDISSKLLGRTKNKLNNARATIAALKKLKA